jgi:hypothetical protein
VLSFWRPDGKLRVVKERRKEEDLYEGSSNGVVIIRIDVKVSE